MIIEVTGGKVVIDNDDLEKVQQYKWHISNTGYAVWRGIKDGKKQTIRMHRLIANTPHGMITDHLFSDDWLRLCPYLVIGFGVYITPAIRCICHDSTAS